MTAACEDRELLLAGLVDGELDAANTALAEAHVVRCDGCREQVERLQAVRNLLGTEGVRHGAPDSLRQRIAALPKLAPPAANSNRVAGWLGPTLGGALAASIAIAVFVSPGQSALDQQIISSHVRSLQPGHLTDVRTTSQHIVKPWFNGRIAFAPPVPDLADRGFPLIGGRLDSIDGKTVAAVVYRRRLHTVNVFIWPADTGRSRTTVHDGFALREWHQGGLTFAVVSDLAPEELRQFESLYRPRSR